MKNCNRVLTLITLCFTVTVSLAAQNIDPPPGMIAWWPLDEMSGPAEDLVASNNGEWINTPAGCTGMVAGALQITSSDDYVKVPHDYSLNIGEGDFSIDMWIKTNQSDGVHTIIDKRSNSQPELGFTLYVNNGNLGLKIGDANGYYNFNSQLYVADDEWHGIAVTVDRDDPEGLIFYVDNLFEKKNPMDYQGSLSNDGDLLIGGNNITLNHSLGDGCLDEIEIFNRVLHPSELEAIYSAGSDGKDKALYDHKMHWPQLPDNQDGFCVNASFNGSGVLYIADDFECTESGLITDITLWGQQYEHDPEDIKFYIAIADKNGNDVGSVLWQRTFNPGEVSRSAPISATTEYWYSGSSSASFNSNNYWRYDISDISNAFYQEEGETYWLIIQANVYNNIDKWGWRNSASDFYGSPAKYGTATAYENAAAASWNELNVPGSAVQTLEKLAFVLRGDAFSNIPFEIMSTGEPVPGADIFIEQEPDDEPIFNDSTTSRGTTEFSWTFTKSGSYSINIIPDAAWFDSLSSGDDLVTSTAPGNKGGFAIGGFNPAKAIPKKFTHNMDDVNIELYPPGLRTMVGDSIVEVGHIDIGKDAVPYAWSYQGFVSYFKPNTVIITRDSSSITVSDTISWADTLEIDLEKNVPLNINSIMELRNNTSLDHELTHVSQQQNGQGSMLNFVPADSGLYTITYTLTGTRAIFQPFKIFLDVSITDSADTAIKDNQGKLPDKLCLEQNYPNPFNPSTTIPFTIPKATKVKVYIYNIEGSLVEILLDKNLSKGSHSITWDASDFSSGIYIYRIDAGKYSDARKCLYFK